MQARLWLHGSRRRFAAPHHEGWRPSMPAQFQLLNVPSRSLKRSSRPGARTSGLWSDKTVFADVSDELLPHNSCTAGEIGCVRSPAWNSERKIGSDATEAVCDVAATGVTLR